MVFRLTADSPGCPTCYAGGMPNRVSKPRKSQGPTDVNVLAARAVAQLTGQAERPPATDAADTRNPHAVALGKLGGAKGGKARAAKLSRKRRQEIAKLAANSRWQRRA